MYRISENLAMIQTVDFFTPMVDDPFDFGRIAAANAISDVYAMGGIPKTAMNLVAFPVQLMDICVLRKIIEGGLVKMKEAGVILVGGHSIEDKELKYGLSVTGFVHPDRVLRKKNIHAGDLLILTKPLGTGIINTAIKGGLASEALIASVTGLMAELNRNAALVMARYPVHACTDITGFGLIGHLAEMVTGSGCGARVFSKAIPVIPEVFEYADMGIVPAGAYRNREFRESMVKIDTSVHRSMIDVLYDPQTSGGLLISAAPESAENLLRELRKSGVDRAAVIGEVVTDPKDTILVF